VTYNLHISVILSAIGLVLLNDFIGLFWALGLKQQFSEQSLRIQHRVIGVAFIAAIGTGIAASIAKPEVLRHNGFWIKMIFVATIGLNGWFMGKKCQTLAQHRFRTLPSRTKVSISLSVILSLFLWLATALIGLFAMREDFHLSKRNETTIGRNT
jgi:hypothetical protein